MKTYLVKKDVNKPNAEDNWIIMNGYDFARFMETEEGRKRKRNFARLESGDGCDDTVVIECGSEKAKVLENERQCERYHRNVNGDFASFSFDYHIPGRGNYCGDDVLQDPAITLSEYAVRNDICVASAHGRKIRAFRKLKNYFEKCGYGSENFA